MIDKDLYGHNILCPYPVWVLTTKFRVLINHILLLLVTFKRDKISNNF